MPKRKSVHHRATATKSRRSLTLTAKSVIAKLPSFERKKTLDTTVKRRWFRNRKVIDIGVSGLAIVSLIVAILLPLANAQASETLNWSTNADFGFNKTSKCQSTQRSSLTISGANYTDATCATAGADSSISLSRDVLRLKDVQSFGAAQTFTMASKKDGTVWGWGYNGYGQLGDGTTATQQKPVQVKGVDGVGFLTDIKEVVAAEYTSLALKNDGTVWAWGYNPTGQIGDGTSTTRPYPVQVKGLDGTGFLTNVKQISATGSHILALKNDGTVWGWGYNNNGAVGDGTSNTRYTPVQVKDTFTTFLTGVATINAGRNNSFAAKTDGTVWGWGYNGNGEIGDNTFNNRYYATQVHGVGNVGFLTDVVALTAGEYHAAALKSDGSAYIWGTNGSGQFGNNSNTSSPIPTPMKTPEGQDLTDAISIDAGQFFTAVVREGGTVWTSGSNNYSQLGNNTYNPSSSLTQVKSSDGTGVLSGIKRVQTGFETVLALTADSSSSLLGWGNNNYGQVGLRVDNATAALPQYIIVNLYAPKLTGFSEVSVGQQHTIGLKPDGTVWTWGYNSFGQLGQNTYDHSPVPVQVKSADGNGFLTDVVSVVAGDNNSGAVKSDGTVWTWGYGSYGQIGNAAASTRLLPTQVLKESDVTPLTNIKQLAIGTYAMMALDNDGDVWSWGYNPYGQLGTGDGNSAYAAIHVKDEAGLGNLSGISAIAMNYYTSAALKSDGTVLAWGNNNYGQLGDGTTTTRLLPVQVGAGTLTDITQIALGAQHGLARKSDGTVWSWGYNVAGALGDGTTTNRNSPVQVKNVDGSGFLSGISSIGANSTISMAIGSGGSLWGWGENYYSQIGDATSTNRLLPTRTLGVKGIGQLSGVTKVALGNYHTVVITGTNDVLTWGTNNSGSIGYDQSGNLSSTNVPREMVAEFTANAGYATNGTASGYVVDAGAGKKYQWNTVNWASSALAENTGISFATRTSNDGTTWSAWSSEYAQSGIGSTTGEGVINGSPITRFIELRATLTSPDQAGTPRINDFSVTYINDDTAPVTNASDIELKTASNGAGIAENAWMNDSSPYFSWAAGADDNDGMGLAGYCIYLGQDASANVQQTKGILGNSPVDTNGACPYAVPGTSVDLSAIDALATPFVTSSQPYHLLVKALDKAGNLFTGSAESFSFKYDNTPPTNPAFMSAPSQFIASKEATITWPATGAQSANDVDSGLAGLQYKIGANGTWFGADHTGAQDVTDVLENNGTYTTDATHDYPLLQEGNNIMYFRTIDNAGNVSTSNNTAAIKINTTSPTPPQNLTATPTTSTTNSFAFAWQAPSSFVGPGNALTYCYTVNTLPTDITCTFTPAGQTSLAADAFATQPGTNTMYVVARDEAGNVNYDTYATVEFTANTPAPGIPIGTEIADISTKATQTWKLALSWAAPGNVGAGVSKYAIYRSTNGTTFSQVATTSGLSYVDSSLDQQMYYYKIRACDSANNCGAYSDVFSRTPTGRFTSPPELVTSPSVQVSTKKASFSYVTDRESDSRIQYGTKSGEYFPGEIAVSASTKNHKVEISNLDAGTTYFYKAKWTDEDGNTGTSTELSFTTLPAPSIKNVSVIKQTLSSATIQFTSVDASQVNIYYGKSEGFGGLEKINTSRSESTYTVELSGLDDGSTYLYKFSTFDSDGNEYDSRRADSFTTPQRPRISELRFQPVTGEPTSTQKVTWKTNVPANSTVSYGKIGDATKDIYDATVKTDHEVLIKNLEDASEYSLLAQSRDAAGNLATSDRQTFRTALDTRPPKISDIQIESLVKGNGSEARGQIVVSWKTDEPATSQIAYAQGSTGSTYASQTAEDGRLTTEHVVIVSDLAISSVYHLQPISRDKSANVAKGDDKSAIIGRATDSVLNIILSTLNRIFGL